MDDVEVIAKELNDRYPSLYEGAPVGWNNLIRQFPEYAESYRKAARIIMSARQATFGLKGQ